MLYESWPWESRLVELVTLQGSSKTKTGWKVIPIQGRFITGHCSRWRSDTESLFLLSVTPFTSVCSSINVNDYKASLICLICIKIMWIIWYGLHKSPDLDPVKHPWQSLERRVRQCSPSPLSTTIKPLSSAVPSPWHRTGAELSKRGGDKSSFCRDIC